MKRASKPFIPKLMTKSEFNAIVVILLLLLAGCSRSPRGEQFSYSFSMESINNYRVELQLHPDSSWTATRYNYFFDRFGGAPSALERAGQLTDEEYARFSRLLEKSGLEGMDESYGFDSEEDTGNSVIYMLSLTPEGEETHYVTIRENASSRFSDGFRDLILYSGSFLNSKLEGASE